MLVLSHNTFCTCAPNPLSNSVRCARVAKKLLDESSGHAFVVVGLQECFAFRAGVLLYPLFVVAWCIEWGCPWRLRWVAALLVYPLVAVPLFLMTLLRTLLSCVPWRRIPWWDGRSGCVALFPGFWHSAAAYPSEAHKFLDSGLLLLSNRRPVRSGFEAYRDALGAEVWAQKGFQWATFRAESGTVLVVHTHTQSDDDPLRRLLGRSGARQLQLRQLREFLNARRTDSTRVVLLGDLNTADPREVERSLGLHVLGEETGIDYVLTNRKEGRSVVRTFPDPCSDHPLLRVTIP